MKTSKNVMATAMNILNKNVTVNEIDIKNITSSLGYYVVELNTDNDYHEMSFSVYTTVKMKLDLISGKNKREVVDSIVKKYDKEIASLIYKTSLAEFSKVLDII